jgi:4-amino-4-deoxy-L-arabinose transferase-like glycosyltransferase
MNPVDTPEESGTIDLFSPPGWDEATADTPVFQIADPPPVAATPRFIRPGRARLPEVMVAALSLLLNAWRLDRNGLGNSYYAAAVRSMTTSWKAFFYGSLDPGNWITTDKPPGALWLQALSARIFGYSGWSVLLPSAVCGAFAVYVLTVTVRRVWGTTAGLVAGTALALTPAVVAVSRSNNPDALLMLAVVAAAWATERAITTKRVHWLLFAGAICGFGFLTKLLVVGLVMPGLWLGYLVAARESFARRCLHLVAATGLFATISLAWVAAVDLTPITSRPYIGGSTNNTALDLAFGYRGVGRLTGSTDGGGPRPGGPNGPGGFQGRPPEGFPGTTAGGFSVDEFGGQTGVSRLFNNGMGDQVMWLAPIAAISFLAAAITAVRRRSRDARLGSLVMFAGWTAATFVVFSFISGVFHNYYVSLLAPAAAALCGIGASLAIRSGRVGRWITAVALTGTALVQGLLIGRVGGFGWLNVILAIGVLLFACSALSSLLPKGPVRRFGNGLGIAAALVAFVAPGVWATAGTTHSQNATFPDARPIVAGVVPFGVPGAAGIPGTQPPPGAPNIPAGRGAPPFGPTGLDGAMLDWLRTQRTSEKWLVAVQSAMQASSALIAGDSVMPIGGFSGGDSSLSIERLAGLIKSGDLRFVMTGGGFGGGPQAGGANIIGAVETACVPVSATTWGGSGSSSLLDCAGQADNVRANGP